jgi:uncharacterized protein
MKYSTQPILLQGPAGTIEALLDLPKDPWHGLALVAHPHPLFGGTNSNKVTQILAQALAELGYACVRPNFRGVGASEGEHADGVGEQEDMLAVSQWMRQAEAWGTVKLDKPPGDLPLVLAGFSFGSYVLSHLALQLKQLGLQAKRLILVGTPTSRWKVAQVPENTLLIHGEQDETIPLSDVVHWAQPQNLTVKVIPGADHFFHHKLMIIKRMVQEAVAPSSD